MKTKYYFYFGFSYVGIYKGWVEEARNAGLPIEMITFLSVQEYLQNREEIAEYNRHDYISIYPAPPSHLVDVVALLYFALDILRGRRVVVHARKRKQWPLKWLKSTFGSDRLKYVIKVEGDQEAEIAYLEKNPYKEGFYDDLIADMKSSLAELPDELAAADGVLTVSEPLRDRLQQRYGLNCSEKIRVVPTGVDTEKFYPDEEVRQRVRSQLGVTDEFVFIYLGNAFYSWQNVKRTVEIVDLLDESGESVFLLLLVPGGDHHIVEEFIQGVGLSEDSYHLTEAPHSEVSDYLNAADMGVLLRDDAYLNEGASPGKYGEYLAAGIPVLTTPAARDASELAANEMGVILEDIHDDATARAKLTSFIEQGGANGSDIHDWAEPRFGTTAYIDTYLDLMKLLGDSDS